jgi:NADH-quinone oxidoreductase subunit J
MVLFLFALMFINMNQEAEPHKGTLLKVAAVVSGGLLLLVLAAVTKGADAVQTASVADGDAVGTVKNLGKALYGNYLLPFELTSVLLLAAMVGAVMLGKKQIS